MLYAGTSGWAYAGWKPAFYPAKTPSKKFLEVYATRLNSVEVNYTFRRYPSEKLLAGWIASTPAGFRFSVKANQLITHIKRLRDAREVTQRFLSSLQLLVEAGKLGVVLYQLPPFLKADSALLSDFLALLPAAVRSTFEFRHDSWFTEETFALCARPTPRSVWRRARSWWCPTSRLPTSSTTACASPSIPRPSASSWPGASAPSSRSATPSSTSSMR